ncbi:bifunctional ADP-dependent NAD(P)H-hydrate dehydratase/NAD(P)H-hydrate epimerase [Nevskia ramosa]|uniref:bifunctional ADP-dependent NAD(P)H-hydrate dehydratase/NAD(P)H-hydrate epimerase n=1 Tax=Nevskia ramosa TaxID=64002 RepID=UPI0003B6BCA5|nr:bifunctional ADP-dependent NAD(P)H-hydrate dehydratase/NAD(P)H-hydrate epimerase [Nevskia ramosa]
MENIAARLYSAAQVRELDRRAIEDCGIPGFTLMQRAALAAWRAARGRWPELRAVTVLCGPGNNGGDGYELARLAIADGCTVQVLECEDLPRRGDALTARAAWLAVGAVERWSATSAEALLVADLIVDALYGVGLSRALEGETADAIVAANAAHANGVAVLALDIPSGLIADTGHVPGKVINADLTVTFIAQKIGLLTGQGPAFAGHVELATLDVPEHVHDGLIPIAERIDASHLRRWLPRRSRTGHKGDHGHVLLIGGDHGMLGAILLAGRAALRAGAGLVTIATRAAHAQLLAAAQPDLMVRGIESPEALATLIARADVIAVGPGLGTDDWSRVMFDVTVAAALPTVVDADALNLLAQQASPHRRDDWLLTPHPGEAGRLLGCSTAAVQRDRIAAVQALQARYGGVVVLKGAGSLIADGEVLRICPYGNPGMGVGGMGDVLTGIGAAFLAQGLPLGIAAAAAVTAHARAGDAVAIAGGERGLIASDVVDALRAQVNP